MFSSRKREWIMISNNGYFCQNMRSVLLPICIIWHWKRIVKFLYIHSCVETHIWNMVKTRTAWSKHQSLPKRKSTTSMLVSIRSFYGFGTCALIHFMHLLCPLSNYFCNLKIATLIKLSHFYFKFQQTDTAPENFPAHSFFFFQWEKLCSQKSQEKSIIYYSFSA